MMLEGLAGTAISTVFGLVNQNKSEKEQKQLQSALQSLSDAQLQDLEKKLLRINDALERERLVLQTIAVSKNQSLIDDTEKKKKTGIIIAIGLVAATALIIILNKLKK